MIPCMSSKPNIVLIVADQLNIRHLGCSGNPFVKTPNIDRLANEGAYFANAYCQAPLCMPSRSSFNTGLYPHSCGVRNNPVVLRDEYTTLAEMLEGEGYETAGFGHIGGDGVERGFKVKVDLPNEPIRSAWMKEQDFVLKGGGKPASFNGTLPFGEDETFDGLATQKAVDFIRDTNDPFYLQVDFYKPHIPHVVTEKYSSMYDLHAIELPYSYRDELAGKPSNLSATRKATCMEGIDESELKKALAHYYGAITFVDDLTGRIISELERKGVMDNTLIIFMADHGDYAGEFGLIGKTGNFYECLTHVPLIMRCPCLNIPSNRHTDALVELIDIVPTVLEACNAAKTNDLQGTSRLFLAQGGTETGAEAVFCESTGVKGHTFDYKWEEKVLKPNRTDPYSSGPCSFVMSGVMMRKGDYKFIYYEDGSKELYDLCNDKYEINNLADNQQYIRILDAMTQELLRWQIRTWTPEKLQRPLPYHYRATSMEALSPAFHKQRKEWESKNI